MRDRHRMNALWYHSGQLSAYSGLEDRPDRLDASPNPLLVSRTLGYTGAVALYKYGQELA